MPIMDIMVKEGKEVNIQDIVKAVKEFKKYPLGGTFYPVWMERISKKFAKALRNDKNW
jgi:hypothetical protein